MEHLIPVVNKLQDVFGAIGQTSIDLPQITVVGSQSAGKSSVLENIVGRDFLPRGNGVVTRRPLILQLYCQSDSHSLQSGEEWGEFLHLPGQRFSDFNEIRNEIQRETDRLTGQNKGLSSKPINLKIFSPYVLNLTLVDLPGITKVPTGDQPEDVEEQIRLMCLEFISNPNAIILAVSAANQDLVNSDGLKLARSVDPDGERTIGVLTKVDIMDAGTDCADVLNNKVVPLRRGYVAVVNRSQKDIADQVPIRKGLTKEASFFSSHPKYRTMITRCGTTNLARSLNQILMLHIRDCLPEIKARIASLMAEVQSSLSDLGDPTEGQEGNKLGSTMLRLLSRFSASFAETVEGRKGRDLGGVDTSELYGGARISYIFNEVFGKCVRNLDPFAGLSDTDIRTAIANANGPRPSLFVPEISFDLLVRRQILRLEQPGLQCVDLVFAEMQRMAIQSETGELSRFPHLRERVFEIVNQILRSSLAPTQSMISNLIQIELAYINTSHPDFIGGKQAVAQLTKRLSTTTENKSTSALSSPSPSQIASSSLLNSSGDSTNSGLSTAAVAHERAGGSSIADRPADGAAMAMGAERAGGGAGGSTNGEVPRGFFGLFRPTGAPGPQPGMGREKPPLPSKEVLGGLVKLPPVPDRMTLTNSLHDREKIETEIIKSLISSYFDIVKKNFTDLVPKTIMHFLVIAFKEGLQNSLVSQLYKDSMVAELMQENEDVAAKRKQMHEMRELLQHALEIVNEVRDFNTFK